MREFDVLAHIFQSNSRLPASVLVPPGDDMALVELRGRRLLAAVDQLVDGRHVDLTRTPIELAGRKAITRSLSDIAAMAGTPLATLVAATLPPDFDEQRAATLFDAMRAACEQFHCPLIGGDLAFHSNPSAPLVCSVTVLAEQAGDRTITRGGAKPGDIIGVSGPLGGSLQPDGLGRHLTFEPRIELALQLAKAYGPRLHAMIDISDGLGRDASHIAQMSNVQIVLEAQHIPCNPGCDWKRALGDGEDYELCFAVHPPFIERIHNTSTHNIGEVRARTGDRDPWVIVRNMGQEIAADDLGWQHHS